MLCALGIGGCGVWSRPPIGMGAGRSVSRQPPPSASTRLALAVSRLSRIVEQALFGRQRRGLGLHHGGVGHGAEAVLVERQPLGLARGGDGGALHLLLLHQDALLHQRILDLLEGHQDGLAIERDLGVVLAPARPRPAP